MYRSLQNVQGGHVCKGESGRAVRRNDWPPDAARLLAKAARGLFSPPGALPAYGEMLLGVVPRRGGFAEDEREDDQHGDDAEGKHRHLRHAAGDERR